MRSLAKSLILGSFLLHLSACAGHKSSPNTAPNALDVVSSELGVQCQQELRKTGVIAADQKLSVVTDANDVSEMNTQDPATLTMNITDFKSRCFALGFNLDAASSATQSQYLRSAPATSESQSRGAIGPRQSPSVSSEFPGRSRESLPTGN